ncbi:MAG: rhodanese-like domain-containing protein [Gemmatimonadaceae bacterium]
MFLQRFYHEGLAQASYMIACQAAGEALVVDANRNLDVYLSTAAAHSFRITHVTETHIHADYVSGSRDLARRAHAQLLLSAEGGCDWQYRFARESGAALLSDRDVVRVGNIELRAVHTPGHTPEHLTFIVTDLQASNQPMGALTGDFIFVGDVGRPDLLERAAGIGGTMRASALQLYESLQRFASAYPDHLQIWPGHGAGSACGKALGAVPMSTLGYEKLVNWAFQAPNAESFANEVLDSQSEPPPYFAVMKRVNRDGPTPLADISQPTQQPASTLAGVIDRGAIVLDLRPTAAFARGAVPGTINLPLNSAFVSRAGWLVPYDRDVYLIAADDTDTVAHAAARELLLIGIERVRGWFGPEALSNSAHPAQQTIPQVTAAELARRVRGGSAAVIDVRNPDEWAQGHIAGAVHIPLGRLGERAATLPAGTQLVLHCATGSRSSIGASVLLALGMANVANLEGGYAAWQAAGLPVTQDGEGA